MFGFNKKAVQINNGFIKKKFKIEGMHCSSCALSIDGDLEELEGVKAVNTNYARSICEVEYDPQKLIEAKIIDTIKKTGYTAIPVSL